MHSRVKSVEHFRWYTKYISLWCWPITDRQSLHLAYGINVCLNQIRAGVFRGNIDTHLQSISFIDIESLHVFQQTRTYAAYGNNITSADELAIKKVKALREEDGGGGMNLKIWKFHRITPDTELLWTKPSVDLSPVKSEHGRFSWLARLFMIYNCSYLLSSELITVQLNYHWS